MSKNNGVSIGALRKVTLGTTIYIKPNEMEKGQTLAGTFLRSAENDYGFTYFIDTDNGTVGLNGAGLLDYAMKAVQPGQYVKIVYGGRTPSTKYKGKELHNFDVYVADYLDNNTASAPANNVKSLAAAKKSSPTNGKTKAAQSFNLDDEDETDTDSDDILENI